MILELKGAPISLNIVCRIASPFNHTLTGGLNPRLGLFLMFAGNRGSAISRRILLVRPFLSLKSVGTKRRILLGLGQGMANATQMNFAYPFGRHTPSDYKERKTSGLSKKL